MKYIIYTDGASKGNPGPSSVGVVIQNKKGEILKEYSHYLGDKLTNNEAEYGAVVFALKKIKSLIKKDKMKVVEIEFYIDSKLVVEQLMRRWKIKHPNMEKLSIQVHNLIINFKKVSFFHIPREQNTRADALANQAF